MKVLIAGGGTGGHLMPALAIAAALEEQRPDIQLLLVGSERGIEKQVLPKYSYAYRLLPSEPLYRGSWWRNVRWIRLAWRLKREVDRLLDTERPDVVVSTGGYAAGPVVWRAQRRGIPTALQEQNAFPGLTTRWLARHARHIYLGIGDARDRLSTGAATRIFTFGNPIRPPATNGTDRAAALRDVGLERSLPCVFVFGGSQGSQALNSVVAGALEQRMLDGIGLLWGTGPAHADRYAAHAVPGRVVVRGFFDPIAPAYRAAELVVARAGAMTIAELCAWGKPSVLVPLKTAAADHQTHNARALASAGAAVLLPESDLTPDSFARLVVALCADRPRLAGMAERARAHGHPEASREIAAAILTL